MRRNLDGEVHTYQADKGVIVFFIDENNYRKQERALKKYCMKSYKNLMFDIIPNLKSQKLEDGEYETDLITDSKFEKVYGTIKLKYYVKKNVIIIKNIEPDEMLIDMYSSELPTYKGVPYRNQRDMFRIRFVLEQEGENNGKKI